MKKDNTLGIAQLNVSIDIKTMERINNLKSKWRLSNQRDVIMEAIQKLAKQEGLK